VPWNALRRERWSGAGRRAAIVVVDHRHITSFSKTSETSSMPCQHCSRENLAVLVRPAASADAVVIASILNAFLTTTTIEWTDTPYTEDGVLTWLNEHETVLVAEERGEVVGVAAFGWFRDAVKRPGYRFTVETTIHVREAQWHSGVGHQLMRALVEEARASGKHTMVAAIDSANEASIRFHERLGFVEVARLPEVGVKFGRWLDLVLLQLRLDDRRAPSDG